MSSSDEVERVLLLSPVDPAGPPGGREMLSRANLTLLRDLLGDRLTLIRPARSSSGYTAAWRGYIDGVDAAFIAEVLSTIAAQRITQMFVDGSNFGAVVAAVKDAAPHVRTVTFFHNVEARFFWGSLRARRSAKSVAVLLANYLAERKAVRWSDVLVTLSERDSAGLFRLYGRAADRIAPIVLEDKRPTPPSTPAEPPAEPYALFVGGGFYANIAGMQWFAQAVGPRMGLQVMVVGRGMEVLADSITGVEGITLVGAVDDLSGWYAHATVVIAPILDGSGMKTKVAEALMHGKHIIGTAEAFSGYADDVLEANWNCADADAFATAIEQARREPPPLYDPAMRALYERDHSPAAARARLSEVVRLPNQATVA